MSIKEKTKALIDEKYKKFTPEVGLIKDFYTPNYHSNLKPGEYHFIQTGTLFAIAVFSSGYEEYYPQANEMLRKVISCQCRTGETTGLWPYFYEEPLEKMVAPDWNFADFHAMPMLTILLEHADKLEEGMYETIKEALLYACIAIKKRNLTILYTNPICMTVYIMTGCGDLFNKPELTQYGLKKLNEFYLHVMNRNSFDEYNCPGYNRLVAQIFSLILRNIKNEEVLRKVTELNDMLWDMIGTHFHYATGEFSAPKFRQYFNFINENDKAIYQRSVSEELALTDNPQYGFSDLYFNVKCPDKFRTLFTDKDKTLDIKKFLTRGFIYPYLGYTCVEMLYMKPEFTLGCFDRTDGWNQTHGVEAYVGNRTEKCCIRLRMLHDNYDYCSGFFASAQEKGSVMTVTNFLTDRGDTHNDLDKVIDAKIKTTDFKLRYQVEANTESAIEKVTYETQDNKCILNAFGTEVTVEFIFAEFSGEKPYMEVTKSGNSINIDMVIYHGEEKIIDFNKIEAAAFVSSLSVGNNELDAAKIEKDERYIYASRNINGSDVVIRSVYKPQEQIPAVTSALTTFNGENIITIAEKNR